MKSLEECDEITNNPKIVLTDQRSRGKIEFVNQNCIKIRKIKIDKCVFEANDPERCDYLLIPSDNEFQHYVELKGGAIRKALSQIENTIKHLKTQLKDNKRFAYIIGNRYPKNDPRIENAKSRFSKNYNCRLQIKNLFLSVNL